MAHVGFDHSRETKEASERHEKYMEERKQFQPISWGAPEDTAWDLGQLLTDLENIADDFEKLLKRLKQMTRDQAHDELSDLLRKLGESATASKGARSSLLDLLRFLPDSEDYHQMLDIRTAAVDYVDSRKRGLPSEDFDWGTLVRAVGEYP